MATLKMISFTAIRSSLSLIRAAVLVGTFVILIALSFAFHHRDLLHKRDKAAPKQSASNLVQPHAPMLNVDSIVQHGHIIEIKAQTEPGTTVMVNGEKAAVLFDGSRIRHFVGPLPRGVSVISITAQNDEGGVNTKTVAVDIP